MDKFNKSIGKWVLVRTYASGVIYGLLEHLDGKYSIVKDARIIHRWSGAFTLFNLSLDGLGEDSQISKKTPYIEILDTISILPLSEKALKSLNNVPYHKI